MIEAVKLQFDSPDPGIGVWETPASPFRIEYALALLDEIRHLVSEGFQKLARGGVEVGGILYGTRDGNVLKVTAIRPISCEHARGPGFLLSDVDRQNLLAQIEEPVSADTINLGWFVSHSKSDVSLSDSDLEIYHEYFPAPWQIAMVIRPGRGGSMRAGFFFREIDGTVQGERSQAEFDFPDRLAGVINFIGKQDRRAGNERRRNVRDTTPEEAAPTLEAPHFGVTPAATQRVSKTWLWMGLWALAFLAVAGFALPYLSSQRDPRSLSLTLLEKQGVLQIDWNRDAVGNGTSGTLSIVDGQEASQVTLGQKDVEAGHFAYQRKTGDIAVRLSFQLADGSTVQEASRFLGKVPATDPGEMSAADVHRSQLESEVTRLRTDNAAQQQRIQQLERTLHVLQNRLGVK